MTDRRTANRPLLLMVAAPREAEAVAHGLDRPLPTIARAGEWRALPLTANVHLVQTGIGKVNAGAAAALVASPAHYRAVINLGVAGALPTHAAYDNTTPLTYTCSLGAVVLATHSIYADEGLLTPDGFTDCASLGFPLVDDARTTNGFPNTPRLIETLRPFADHTAPIATISTGSGTDAAARAIAARTGAIAEAMEGAAIAHVCRRLHHDALPFVELRVISNATGDRNRQQWDLDAALHRLTQLTTQLLQALTAC